MVPVPIPAGAPGAPGTYCIDHTEVTNKQYADFLATNPDIGSQPTFCSWNTSFAPETLAGTDNCPNVATIYDLQNHAQNPVACIDWCDARKYCESVGKRLCGAFGGGAVAAGSGSDAKKDEWYAACSAGGSLAFPYGNTFQPQSCNTLDYGATGSVRGGLLGSCVGPGPIYDFIYDMSGNVAEWEDSCAGVSGANDTCYARGGYWNSWNPNPPTATQSSAACNATPTVLGSGSGVPLTRSRRSREIGFRCCFDGTKNN
jgi:formylglycine-generating enzyme